MSESPAYKRLPGDSPKARLESSEDMTAHYRPWFEWAAAQIAASVAGDAKASRQLLEALEAILSATDLKSRARSDAAAEAPAVDDLAQHISAAIIAVQSHDRLVQQLTHVAETLRALHERLDGTQSAMSPATWREFREERLNACSMAEERMLLVRIVATDLCAEDAPAGANIEMFNMASGTDELSI